MKDSATIHPSGRTRVWNVIRQKAVPETIDALVNALHISPLTARLLINRGYTTPEAAELFLGNDERIWHDPFLMADMEHAVERVLRAIREGERIVIYGDYDVDGVTSVTSLYLYLRSLGACVSSYIPNRIGEGYGMSTGAVDRLIEDGVDLIITVDTGITANEEIAHAAALGVDTVVTDHHECHGDLPVCTAVVNPHRPDCTYPFKELAGVGVVFKLICACEAARTGASPSEAFGSAARQFIDLVAIGTIADVMPLNDENRFIVSRGLTMLDHTERPGLIALLDAISSNPRVKPASATVPPPAKKTRRKVNSGLVGFGLAPRINAAGRIAHAMQAVDLLLAESMESATVLAEELCEINTRRQQEENRIAEQAYAMIDDLLQDAEAKGEPSPKVIVLDDDGWMQGIVGIVSSRITEKYGLPSILISFDGAMEIGPSWADVGKGSGRSIKGLNLVEALSDSQDLLIRFGGHELAAGLTIRRRDIPAFRERINAYAAQHISDDMLGVVSFDADCEVTMEEMTMGAAEELERMEPFGVGNPSPHFILRDVCVQKIIPLGGGRHTKLLLYKDGRMLNAIWFSMVPGHVPVVAGDLADILFELNINEYQGVRSLQLIVQDLAPADSVVKMRMQEKERLRAVLDGAPITVEEHLVPTRDDIACVFTLLRHDNRLERAVITERELIERINHTPYGTVSPFGRNKARLILQILEEMGVLKIKETDDGIFVFEVRFDAPKTSIDVSPLLRRLRSQLQA